MMAGSGWAYPATCNSTTALCNACTALNQLQKLSVILLLLVCCFCLVNFCNKSIDHCIPLLTGYYASDATVHSALLRASSYTWEKKSKMEGMGFNSPIPSHRKGRCLAQPVILLLPTNGVSWLYSANHHILTQQLVPHLSLNTESTLMSTLST